MVWLGIGMMIAVAAVFAALLLWGNGELPIKNDTVQGFAMTALMLVLIFGAIFASECSD
jgi:hypothetical protein